MDKDTRNAIERATQKARKLLEEDFAAQLEGDFDVHRDGKVAAKAGKHLSARKAFARERIVAAIEHKRAAGMSAADAARDYLRDAAFTTLNRFVALKMLEARELVQECITKGEQSGGYREFCGMAPGLPLLPESAGYRLYIESLFDELSTEVKVLFDRRDPSSVLWPKRATFEQLLEILNATELSRLWGEDETIGWVYQFFNGQDERRKMREESPAPRNSRELAVRNQFFTPRYVVQFLTDNTLGRIWYEMRETKTALAERCQYLVRKPGEEFAPRTKKDPRDLRVLDPACGSGHFLLYAFDLLLAIYEEAYADPASPKSEATGKTLAEDYPILDALKKAVPGLVLAHNLYGVDIDPRCAQIAQLALWMRAQKAYRDFGIGRGERAQIRRSNIVVAEPLIADEQIAKEFVAKLGDAELGRVFTSLVESLGLAGDLGLLLRVEQLVPRQAERGQTLNLFSPPEERIRAALERFESEENGATNTRRRLFADDAAHGVAFLAVAEKKFDTVLMNPPFGAGSTRAKKEFERAYPRTKNDVYAAFIERSMELLARRGRVGAITSGTYFNLSTFKDLRSLLLSDWASKCFVDLGTGVMDDAAVSAACAVVENQHPADEAELVFVDMRFAAERGEALRAALADSSSNALSRLSAQVLRRLPDQMFGYWLPLRVHRLFSELPSLGQHAVATFGLHCRGADERFYRAWWEVDSSELVPSVWPAVYLGGTPQHFYRDTYYVVNWRDQARMLREVASHASGGTFTGRDHYFRPGLTYIYTAQTTFSVQPLPEGSVFTAAAHGLFPDRSIRAAWLAWLNSEAVRLLTKVINPNRFFQASYVRLIPVPEFGARARELEALSQRAIALSIEYVSGDECSRHYHGDWASTSVSRNGNPFERARARAEKIAAELQEIEGQVNALVEAAYGLSDDDLGVMSTRIGTSTAQALPGSIDIAVGGELAVAREHCSAMIGASLGRWDSERFAPLDSASAFDPFAALQAPAPLRIPSRSEGILVDDEGYQHDIVAQVEARLSTRWRSNYPLIAARLVELLGSDLRQWIRREFWAYHLGRYSFSQATAPIYWQLATPSAGYSVWLYLHAFSKDTLFRVQNDYVARKLAHEERRLESLTSELREGATAAQRKQLAAQEALVEELRAFLDEVKRVAPLWKPNLDDGVIINFAPLWRLVPQNKAWQKELKSTWDALADGKYDWAHFAMHLWPERVVPKCAKDRSLAIAHGLEDVFWIERTDGKWTARKKSTKSVDELVKERTSPAVKSALKSLLEAPVVSGKSTGRNGGGRRKAAAAAEGGDA